MNISELYINDYQYLLPDEKIAKFPAKERDLSKLLIYQNKTIKTDVFKEITQYLPADSYLIFNNTKVIPSRLYFKKDTGADIELFCIEPISTSLLYEKDSMVWKCLIRNAKKWKSGLLVKSFLWKGETHFLYAQKLEPIGNAYQVRFEKTAHHLDFFSVLDKVGEVPLPPYMNRTADETDKQHYQTVYAQYDGSVAAPTAGLHFTDAVFERLKSKHIVTDFVRLHVGAGTFMPVKTNLVSNHEMHLERIEIDKTTILNLLHQQEKKRIAVGTTTIRSLESLYWYGVKLEENETIRFNIEQWEPYSLNASISVQRSLENVLRFMDKHELDTLSGQTKIMIVPGYQFKMINGMVTNFHQPASTLLLLIAAFLGEDWKNIYHYALENDFRFLSYGDSCLFL